MHASEVTREVVERANELYWGSDESVNRIADDLDLSKGALYGIIEPEASGRGCPLCGDEVVYANRTAKDRGMLACPTCEWDGTAEEAMDQPAADDPAPRDLEPEGAATGRGDNRSDRDEVSPQDSNARPDDGDARGQEGDVRSDDSESRSDDSESRPDDRTMPASIDREESPPSDEVPPRPLVHADPRTIAGGALLGAAVGLALVLWTRRR